MIAHFGTVSASPEHGSSEKKKALHFDSLRYMAERVEGSFTFTVLDREDDLYIVKGDNPFCLVTVKSPGGWTPMG